MHKENRVLRKVKPLLTKLHGDYTWIPCGVLVGSNDQEFFTDTERFLLPSANGSSKASAAPSIVNGGGQGKLTEALLRTTAQMRPWSPQPETPPMGRRKIPPLTSLKEGGGL